MEQEQEPDWADGDAGIAALLDFEPVVRKNKRHDGWWPYHQRGFIAALARLGNVDLAAQSVERTSSGAWKVREAAGAESFADAWDGALALFHRRNPNLSRRGGRARPPWSDPAPPKPAPRPAREARARAAGEPEDMEDAERLALLDEIFRRYVLKLRAERECRLAGRIVEADFYVRQLTQIELILDVGGRMQMLLNGMSWDGLHLLQVSATPGSALLEKLRRAYWLEKGEADRPPPAPLGRHNERFATGEDRYDPERDGDRKAWEGRQAEKHRLAAEAQAEWEARAKAEAERRAGDAPANDPDPAP